MRTAILAALMLPAAVMAHEQSRVATPTEQKTFETFYRAHYPSGPVPEVQVHRRAGGLNWRLSASVDTPPQRAVLPLCRLQRTVFEREGKAWHEREHKPVFTWIHHTPQCGTPPAALVELRTELPEIDILRLLQQQSEILKAARLLMAGNTSCAPMRSRTFRLSALELAPDSLPLLVFENDIGGTARIAVRKSRAELTAWNVYCRR
jgi:hypothetical protein